MEVDPLFIGPAALAKAYRFVGDPRDAAAVRAPEGPRRGPARHLRLHALLQVHRGVPQGRRADEPDHAPAPPRRQRPPHRRPQQRRAPRGGLRHAGHATTACCTRPSCCRAPTAATRGSASSPRPPARSCSTRCRSITKALLRRKVTPKGALKPHKIPKADLKAIQRIFETVEEPRRAPRAQPLHLRAPTRTTPSAVPSRPTAAGDDDGAPSAPGSQPRRESEPHEGRLLARLRQPRLHPRAARLDGAGRAAARHRARRSSTARAAPAPASSPSTTRSSPTR